MSGNKPLTLESVSDEIARAVPRLYEDLVTVLRIEREIAYDRAVSAATDRDSALTQGAAREIDRIFKRVDAARRRLRA